MEEHRRIKTAIESSLLIRMTPQSSDPRSSNEIAELVEPLSKVIPWRRDAVDHVPVPTRPEHASPPLNGSITQFAIAPVPKEGVTFIEARVG